MELGGGWNGYTWDSDMRNRDRWDREWRDRRDRTGEAGRTWTRGIGTRTGAGTGGRAKSSRWGFDSLESDDCHRAMLEQGEVGQR